MTTSATNFKTQTILAEMEDLKLFLSMKNNVGRLTAEGAMEIVTLFKQSGFEIEEEYEKIQNILDTVKLTTPAHFVLADRQIKLANQ